MTDRTNAERQRRYRERGKAARAKLRAMERPMTERRCEHCEWWVKGALGLKSLGHCRGAPPAINPADPDGIVFPVTGADDWCGAFRLAERLCANPIQNTAPTYAQIAAQYAREAREEIDAVYDDPAIK